MAKRSTVDWEAIEAEWRAGQREIKQIAIEHGVTDAAIHLRAKRKGWPPRADRIEIVSQLVSRTDIVSQPANNPRVALTAFQRCMELLYRHRRQIGSLADGIAQDLADLEAILENNRKLGRKPTLEQIKLRSEIRARVAASYAKLIPLERAAFGIASTDTPSEFDGLTREELQAVIETVKRALA